MRMFLVGGMVIGLAAEAAAQRGAPTGILSPPNVRVGASPLSVTIGWQPVSGATEYQVEQATDPAGPWTPVPFDPRAGTRISAPTYAALNGLGGTLYYYRVTASAPKTKPGIALVPRVTPRMEPPQGVDLRQDGADLVVSWVGVPFAVGYLITAAPGPNLAPIQSVEVGMGVSEARLVNIGSATQPQQLTVAVSARYGPGTAVSMPTRRNAGMTAAQTCWPPSGLVGPAPVLSVTEVGATSVRVGAVDVNNGLGYNRVERAPLGSSAWQSVGCAAMAILDLNLAPATQYQYRVSFFGKSAAVGQATTVVTTAPAPDSPIPTATMTGCGAAGCHVTLAWVNPAGIQDYRVESSYGWYLGSIGSFATTQAGQTGQLSLGLVPSGTHTFFLTPLLLSMRPSPKGPGQVSLVVP